MRSLYRVAKTEKLPPPEPFQLIMSAWIDWQPMGDFAYVRNHFVRNSTIGLHCSFCSSQDTTHSCLVQPPEEVVDFDSDLPPQDGLHGEVHDIQIHLL